MKISKLLFVAIIITGLFSSCNKELGDGNSEGSFKSAVTGKCDPIAINGIFRVDSILNNSYYVDVVVNVSISGKFEIRSDTLNGYSFYKTGNVPTGERIIRLYPSGKPLTAGVNTFTIKYGSSTCNFSITVVSATTGNAIYSLGGSPGLCTGVVLNGNYISGIPLNASNTAQVTVNVSAPGIYTITTTSANGIQFTASGIFTVSGTQNVILTGTGIPLASGNFTYAVIGAINICSFDVTCNPPGPITNIDYIPQSDYSNWSYSQVGGSAMDTFYTHVLPGTTVINGNSYKLFENINSILYPGQQLDSFYYRKNGGKYYYIFDDTYYFDNGFYVDGLILDSSLATNASWIINLGSNTWGGLPATGTIKVKILAKGATATIAGNNYNNIIKVEYLFRYNTGGGDVDYDRWESWYARGIGNIYNKYNDIPVTSTTEEEVTRVQVY